MRGLLLSHRRLFQLLALIITVTVTVALVWLMTQKNSPLYQPIKSIQLISDTNQVSRKEIDEAVAPYLGLSFWKIPLHKIQADLTRLDWIKSAEVKRQWPNLLYISFTEQKPVARWNESGLINTLGQVFFPKSITEFENLVQLQGELDDSSAILSQLVFLQKQFDQLDMLVAELSYYDQVWRISVLDGPEIVVDSELFEKKIVRFVRAYPKVDLELRKSARIYDLRYSNGFIIANN